MASRSQSGRGRTRPPHPLVVSLGRERNPIRRLFRLLGPGFITGASDDDPSGIGTYASAGAAFGYGLLWTAVLTFPLMTVVQYICAKIGLVTGKGLAGILRERAPRWVLYVTVTALFAANTINVGADLGAIAASINLLVPAIPAPPLVVPIALAILVLQVFASYAVIARVFQWLGLALVGYVGAALLARPDVGQVIAGTLVPHLSLDAGFLAALVAILGTTISPYLFFWQASHEVEDEKSVGRTRLWQRRGATDKELRYAGADVTAGMLFSNVVMYFVILATGATLHAAGTTTIGSATDAARALQPLAGDLASALLAIGLIGGGVLAVPVLSGSAAYALAEALGWRSGLDERPGRAREFYLVIAIATIIGAAIPLMGINAIQALVVTAVINGLVAPPVLALIMAISDDRRVMGDRVNGRATRLIGWLTVAILGLAAIALIVTTVAG
ncbi:MAG TPA: divalent metal cation transporter [Candidatus Limnocylindrales bacterium]|nr:divalent metal cation transporter [Candidatus Limnocylindrales bacterium]